MVEDEGQKEDKFDAFTPEGEARGYISLEQAVVVAMQAARDEPGDYGSRFAGVRMVFDVAGQEEREDFYDIRLSYRPAGRYSGESGVEQFTIDKTGNIELRQILDEPRERRGIRTLLVLAVGLAVIGAAVGGLLASGVIGGDGEAPPPAAGGVDFIQVVRIDPTDGTRIVVGTTKRVDADFEFKLASLESGTVRLAFDDGTRQTVIGSAEVTGSRVLALSGRFVVPDVETILIVASMGAFGEPPLVSTEAATYVVIGRESPLPAAPAPTSTFSSGDSGAKVSEKESIQTAIDTYIADNSLSALPSSEVPSTVTNSFTGGSGSVDLTNYLGSTTTTYYYCWDITGKITEQEKSPGASC